jgi:hypothetical protein
VYLRTSRPGTRTPQASDVQVGLSGVRRMLLFVAFSWRGTTETSVVLRFFRVPTHEQARDSNPAGLRCAGRPVRGSENAPVRPNLPIAGIESIRREPLTT